MEEWKDVIGYEGLYQVSNSGKVKRFAYYNKVSSGGKQYRKEKLLVPVKHRNGYFFYGLCKDGVGKHIFAHRIVAEAFIPNPNNLPFINHKDENKENNVVSNLEWCTSQYNNTYNNIHKKRIEIRSRRHPKGVCVNSRNVYQYTLDGVFVKEYESTSEAARICGYSQSMIARCARGERSKYKNYVWRYEKVTKDNNPYRK